MEKSNRQAKRQINNKNKTIQTESKTSFWLPNSVARIFLTILASSY